MFKIIERFRIGGHKKWSKRTFAIRFFKAYLMVAVGLFLNLITELINATNIRISNLDVCEIDTPTLTTLRFQDLHKVRY